MRSIPLNGTWRARPAPFRCEGEKGLRRVMEARGGWIEARVPGEVHLDLVRARRMEEPLISSNITRSRWPEQKSWWYRRTFKVPASFLRHERQQFIFEGLDLHAQVFLNGSIVGSAANAFVPAVFDVKRYLKPGRNTLVVRMTAGSELAADAVPSNVEGEEALSEDVRKGAIPNPARKGDLYGHRNWPGRKWLRKPAFEYGWDWIDALPSIGIYRGVRLEGRSHVVLHDLRLDTVFSGRKVFLDGEAVLENLHPWGERECRLEIRIRPPGGKCLVRLFDVSAQVGRSSLPCRIEIPQPRLWWPNGMGAQPLYHVTARVLNGAGECDRREFDVGLRTVEIDRSRLRRGSRFCIKINGQEVFCKGGNWGPADAIPARVTKEKYEALVAEARNAHFNMFRVNGVGLVEAPAFFDACDRAGILLWHDFMFSCSTYPDHRPGFREAVRAETESLVTSLRHHPSIALWCGSNENIWGFSDWWNNDKSGPLHIGGTLIYNQVLPDVCRAIDPRRPYWPCSPFGGDKPNDELNGDCHWWLTSYMSADVSRRVRHEVFDECRARFASEYGFIAPCHMDSIRAYLKPGERTPDRAAWKLHTNTIERGTTDAAIRVHYADPEGLSLRERVLCGQMCQAVYHGHAMEALRFRKGDQNYECQGALIWSYSDCWGETGWSIVDYYVRRKAAYYWVRRACAPVKVIVRRRGGQLVTRVVNDTLDRRAAAVQHGWFRVDGAERRLASRRVVVPANGMVEVARESIPPKRDLDPREWVYAAVMRADGASDDQCVWPLLPHRELSLCEPRIEVKARDGALQVASPVYCHGVHAEDHGRAMLSDNYFDLLPGVPVRITRVDGKPAAGVRFRALTAPQAANAGP